MTIDIISGFLLLVYAFVITYFLGRKHSKKEKVMPATKQKVQQSSNSNKSLSRIMNGLKNLCDRCPGGDCDQCVYMQVMKIIESEAHYESN